EYESVSVSCEEDKEVKAWRVRRKLHKTSSANDSDACSVPAASCSIQYVFESHSGEYWCENHEGEKSRALNISVTGLNVQLSSEASVPLISPDRLQFFEYESVSVSCEEDKEVKAWRVRRKLHKTSSANDSDACSVPAASCSIQYAFESHSGEYWCENHEGEKSRALNISVTAGSVILDVSAQPVKEGSTVTLKCIQEDTE
uniref:Ig-like domain-containing protein n=1 Tax=Poecilia formosa TaxID=48698 RepID=A0A096M849_POEFO